MPVLSVTNGAARVYGSVLICFTRKPLFLLIFLAPAVWASASDNAESWLDRMSEAMRTLNYEGELVYQHGDRIKVLHMIHTVNQGRERERLISLNGVPREVVRDEEAVRCVLPNAKAVSVDRRGGRYDFPALAPLAARELAHLYRVELGEEARVAGRPVRGIAVEPLDAYRYGHRFYLDQEHFLPLKQEVMGAGGERISLMMYSRIKVDPTLPFDASGPSAHSKSFNLIEYQPRQAMKESTPDRWHLKRLPPGFQIRHRDFRQSEDGATLEHLVLGDGLASVSLYLEKADPEKGFDGASRMGAVNIFGRQVDGYQIVVIGEVPAATTRFIARALEFR